MTTEHSTTRVLLVRHGRTTANAAGLLSGRHDPALDHEGLAQAEAVGRAVHERTVALGVDPGAVTIVSSPLGRAARTAAAIADACDAGGAGPTRTGERVLIDSRFIELDYGDWDGHPIAEVPADAWRRWRTDPDFAPPGGETLASVARRVTDALVDWGTQLRGGTLVVASHVSPIKAGVTWALDVGDPATWRMRLSNASICEIHMDTTGPGDPRRTLVSFNETSHLHRPVPG